MYFELSDFEGEHIVLGTMVLLLKFVAGHCVFFNSGVLAVGLFQGGGTAGATLLLACFNSIIVGNCGGSSSVVALQQSNIILSGIFLM